MKMIFKAFAKKLFGTKYEKLKRTFLIDLILFWGLHLSDLRIQTAPFVLYLTAGTFTAGIMWQVLSFEGRDANTKHLFMLPFENRKFVFSYTAALGSYTLLTKTAGLLAVLYGISSFRPAEICTSMLCAAAAVLLAAAVFAHKKYRPAGCFWAAAVTAAMFFLRNTMLLIPLFVLNGTAAALLLEKTDAYFFTSMKTGGERKHKKLPAGKNQKQHSMWKYFFRYLMCHKNYLMNTAVMWGAACILPHFFRELGGLSAMPVGFAILSLNTPVCILLSCDPALEEAVRFLPGQKKAFCIPYCLFLFLCNFTADAVFLCSWQMQNGGVTLWMISAAVFFALFCAACSVLLEWFYPIRGWKTESDLWHHPRKYIVPAAALLLAAAAETLPAVFSYLCPGVF